MRLDEGTPARLRRSGPLAVPLALSGLATLALLAAGCGASGSPAVANVASTTSTVATAASTTSTPATATTTHRSSAGGASGVGGAPAGPGGGGNRTVINIGNPTEGTTFAACMRKHGVPGFPDPNSQGLIQFGSTIDPHSPAFRSAFGTCRKLLPAGFRPATDPGTAGPAAAAVARLLELHARARDQGLPRPDRRRASANPTRGELDPTNPHFEAAYNACKAHLPAGLPSKALGGLAPSAIGGG